MTDRSIRLKTKYIYFFFISVIVTFCSITLFSLDASSSKIIQLGNPSADDGLTGRALNVWDLQVFDGKIYIAGGSTVHNTGPTNVWAYNPVTKTFENEYTVDEEAIEHFKVFDNELYIPAADPRSQDDNKFYRKIANGQWQKYASENIKLAHVRDLIKTEAGHLLLVGNSRNPGNFSNPAIAITTDNGLSFQGAGADNVPSGSLVDYNWFFSIFSYQNNIYAVTSLLRDIGDYAGSIAVYNPESKKFSLDFQLTNNELIPAEQIGKGKSKYGIDTIYRIWKAIEFKDSLIYTVRSYSNNRSGSQKSYLNSLGFYLKQDMQQTPKPIHLPHQAIGEDLLMIDNELYVLANQKISPAKFVIYVYKNMNQSQINDWQEVLHFISKNKARSFEYLDSTFYFGLGQDYGDPVGNSGNIISYKL